MVQQRKTLLLSWLRTVLGDPSIDRLVPASSDASFRSYFRVNSNANNFVVMDAPPDKESIDSWIEINRRLRTAGLSAPEVKAENRGAGFILMNDLGNEPYLAALNPSTVERLYNDALDAISRMQLQVSTDALPVYDRAHLRAEMDLFPEWFLQRHLDLRLDRSDQQLIEYIFEKLVDSALAQPQVFVHRDFHSRNLMCLSAGNPGIIDFQDAVHGPVTYDLVSLLRDCYIEWPAETVLAYVNKHWNWLTRVSVVKVDEPCFRQWFDWMGLQRHLKVLGIFCRLYYRDNKHQYLNDLPLTLKYVLNVADNYREFEPFAEWLRAKTEAADLTQARAQPC